MTPSGEASSSTGHTPVDRGAGRGDGIQVVARVADALRHMAPEPDGLSVSELSRRMALPRSTVYRIMRSLTQEGFARETATKRYVIGPQLIGLVTISRHELRTEIAPHLQKLSKELGETVDLAVLDGSEVLFVDQCHSTRTLRVVSEIGARFPAYCTANGKALLAALPELSVRRMLPRTLSALTPRTVTHRDTLLRELEEVRCTGVAFDLEEHTSGICAIGTAIKSGSGETAAITVPVPTARFVKREQILEALVRTREQIQSDFGWPEGPYGQEAAGGVRL